MDCEVSVQLLENVPESLGFLDWPPIHVHMQALAAKEPELTFWTKIFMVPFAALVTKLSSHTFPLASESSYQTSSSLMRGQRRLNWRSRILRRLYSSDICFSVAKMVAVCLERHL